MNLLLLSGGLTTDAIREAFIRHLPKPPYKPKIVFIGTDTNPPSISNAFQATKQILNALGIRSENISVFNLYGETQPNLKNYNVVYMLDGSPSEYMYMLHKLGLYEQLNRFIREGGFYVGASAGAMITGPCFDVASVSDHVNDVDVKDYCGFGWIDFIPIPHLSHRNNSEKPYEYHRKTGLKMIYITDNQAILVHDDFYKII